MIGAGPAGLACSYYLSRRGYKVSLYEKHSKLGGLLRYGIPDFRLDKTLLDKWLDIFILNKNINVYTNIKLGKDITIKDLKEKNDLIVLALGANISNKMGIDGENNDFVFGGNELLEYKKTPNFKDKKVAIIGGGNVAIDVSRTIKRLGAKEVSIVYRRAEEQMPAEKKEIAEAKKEEIKFLFLTNVIRIINNNTKQIECIKTMLVDSENGGRKCPVNIKDSNFLIDIDYVIMAIGSNPDEETLNNLNINLNKWGYVETDKNYKTSDPKIYAIGDLAGNKKTVACAINTGYECAKNIINYNQ